MYFSVIKIMLKQLIENKKLVFMFWWINVGHQWKIGIKSSPNVSYRQKLIADKAEDKVRYGSFLIHSNCKNSATKCKWNTLLAPMESPKGCDTDEMVVLPACYHQLSHGDPQH